MLPEATLPGGRRTSALGFGCSALVGGRTRAEALRLLEVAFDSGIRHFDVARVYGTGDAESVLGEFAAARRDELTIASKFGIEPAGGAAVGFAKGVVRAATRRSRHALAFARRHGSRTVRRGVFEPGRARAGLEVSLRELRTDRLDAYLMHDCAAADWARPELLGELEGLAGEGRIGSYGPATAAPVVAAILVDAGDGDAAPRIAQFGEAAGEAGPAPRDGTLFVTHGVYRTGLATLRSRLVSSPSLVEDWTRRLDLDLGDGDVVGDLMLAAALRRNQGGIVLVSSSSPARIRRNAACAASSPFATGQLDVFAELIAG